MANAKKCDRCGVYYDKNQKFKLKKSLGDFADGITFTGVNGNVSSQFDLCDDCIERLYIFLGGVKLEKHIVFNK